MTHKIAVIGGDGIGPDVTAEAIKVVRAAGVDIETTDFDLGGQRYLRYRGEGPREIDVVHQCAVEGGKRDRCDTSNRPPVAVITLPGCAARRTVAAANNSVHENPSADKI